MLNLITDRTNADVSYAQRMKGKKWADLTSEQKIYGYKRFGSVHIETLETNNYLNEKDIDFYILVAPNKENVYSNYLENKITRSNRKNSRTEELIEYLSKNSQLNIIYPKEILVKNRKKYNTYYKYDTHWNDYGAYLGTVELMKQIDYLVQSV